MSALPPLPQRRGDSDGPVRPTAPAWVTEGNDAISAPPAERVGPHGDSAVTGTRGTAGDPGRARSAGGAPQGNGTTPAGAPAARSARPPLDAPPATPSARRPPHTPGALAARTAARIAAVHAAPSTSWPSWGEPTNTPAPVPPPTTAGQPDRSTVAAAVAGPSGRPRDGHDAAHGEARHDVTPPRTSITPPPGSRASDTTRPRTSDGGPTSSPRSMPPGARAERSVSSADARRTPKDVPAWPSSNSTSPLPDTGTAASAGPLPSPFPAPTRTGAANAHPDERGSRIPTPTRAPAPNRTSAAEASAARDAAAPHEATAGSPDERGLAHPGVGRPVDDLPRSARPGAAQPGTAHPGSAHPENGAARAGSPGRGTVPAGTQRPDADAPWADASRHTTEPSKHAPVTTPRPHGTAWGTSATSLPAPASLPVPAPTPGPVGTPASASTERASGPAGTADGAVPIPFPGSAASDATDGVNTADSRTVADFPDVVDGVDTVNPAPIMNVGDTANTSASASAPGPADRADAASNMRPQDAATPPAEAVSEMTSPSMDAIHLEAILVPPAETSAPAQTHPETSSSPSAQGDGEPATTTPAAGIERSDATVEPTSTVSGAPVSPPSAPSSPPPPTARENPYPVHDAEGTPSRDDRTRDPIALLLGQGSADDTSALTPAPGTGTGTGEVAPAAPDVHGVTSSGTATDRGDDSPQGDVQALGVTDRAPQTPGRGLSTLPLFRVRAAGNAPDAAPTRRLRGDHDLADLAEHAERIDPVDIERLAPVPEPPAPPRHAAEEVDREAVRRIRDAVAARMRAEPDDAGARRTDVRDLIAEAVDAHVAERFAIERQATAWSPVARERTAAAVHDALFGLGRLQAFADDPTVESIDVYGFDNVRVSRVDGSRTHEASIAATDEELTADIAFLAERHGDGADAFSAESPLLDLELPGGSRLAAVHPPVSPRPKLVVRVHRFHDVRLDDLVRGEQSLSRRAGDFLRAAVAADVNIVVAGAPGAGKTTLLRALADCIPLEREIVTVETERELHLDRLAARRRVVTALQSRRGTGAVSPDGRRSGEVTVADLLTEALRLDAERIVLGELRGPEIDAVFQAVRAGVGVLSTIQANSPDDAIERLAALVLAARDASESYAYRQVGLHIGLVVQVRRERDDDGRQRRVVSHIAEVRPGEIVDGGVRHPVAVDVFARRVRCGPLLPAGLPTGRLLDTLAEHGFDPDRLRAVDCTERARR